MLLRGILLSFLFFISSCSSVDIAKSPPLYHQLGGESGIEKLVDLLIQGIADDDQVFHYFAKSDVTHFRKGFITHLCDISGGPCKYQGDSMIDIHTGMQISEADFNRIVELLIDAMEEAGISYPVQNELLSRLAPLRKNVINI